MIIKSAADYPMNTKSLPDMSGALEGWFQEMTAIIATKTTIDFIVSEITSSQTIMAVIQPFTIRQLMIRPEGQRAWSWYTMHVQNYDTFSVDDIFYLRGTKYRVMEKKDYVDYGYFEYNVIEDYEAVA